MIFLDSGKDIDIITMSTNIKDAAAAYIVEKQSTVK